VLLGCRFAHPILGAQSPRPDESKDTRLVELRQPKSTAHPDHVPFTTPLWHHWRLMLSLLRIDVDPQHFF
jgi:hypothetical protein